MSEVINLFVVGVMAAQVSLFAVRCTFRLCVRIACGIMDNVCPVCCVI